MESDKMESREDSKESGVSFKSDGSKLRNYLKKKLSFRARLRKLLSSGIRCASVKRNNSQGCTADVKETPPSPEENWSDLSSFKKDHVVADDEDLIKSSDDLMASRSMESFNSGVSFKSDQSKCEFIDFKDSSPPRMLLENKKSFDFDVSFKSDQSKNRLILIRHHSFPRMTKGSMESFDSGVHIKIDLSKDRLIIFQERILLRDEMNQELSSEVGWKHC